MYRVDGDRLILTPHQGQYNILQSTSRIIAAIAGTQSGKTVIGPHWLMREIINCGPGDYIVAAPSYPLLNLKLLPEFRRIFEDYLMLGKYHIQSRIFKFSEFGQMKLFGESGTSYDTSIFFGHAQDPESLESATAKAAWLDEAGQKKFKLGSYEAIMRRLAVNVGRLLVTTTPYYLGWLKSLIWDKRSEPHINCFNFKSTMNPTFSIKEYERARSELPDWKFDMFYDGLFTRPAGAIYDCWDDDLNTCKRFQIPSEWKKYIGIDFGAVNTAGLYIAHPPGDTSKLYVYRSYHQGGKSSTEHARDMAESGIYAVGGAPSETQQRMDFKTGGLKVRDPKLQNVEVGIDRTYGAIKTRQLIFFDDLENGKSTIEDMDAIDQFKAYSRKLNDEGLPTEIIEDKNRFHLCDAGRYIVGGKLRRNRSILRTDSNINLN